MLHNRRVNVLSGDVCNHIADQTPCLQLSGVNCDAVFPTLFSFFGGGGGVF